MTMSGSPDASAIEAAPARPGTAVASPWLCGALLVAVLALGGSLFLSLGMGLKACPLCFYQRTFAMSLVAVLGMGIAAGVARGGRLGLLTVPLAVAGLGVAVFHVYLEAAGKLECPVGLLGWGTPPKQSLALFALLTIFLLADVVTGGASAAGRWPALPAGLVLGVLLALGACTSNPPMPEPPKAPYPKPPDVCRPPYHSPTG
jgi:disulfide bond formation protein DsbB